MPICAVQRKAIIPQSMRKLFRDSGGGRLFPRGSVVTVGAFDGVHRGHRALLAAARADADARALPLVALSFEPLPRQFFGGADGVVRLTTPRQKACELREFADSVGLLRFNARLASMDAADFVGSVLVERLSARSIWVGPDFRFGHARRGDIELLRAHGPVHGFDVSSIEPLCEESVRVSSSAIRAALAEGDFVRATQLLGRAFRMSGHVVHGQQLGRKLGYPTANLPILHGRAPIAGIFAVRVHGVEREAVPGVASLGTRPTVGGIEPILEAHLFDWDGDLYGRRIDVEFVAHLRSEAHFDNLDLLVAQMNRDAAQARAMLSPQFQQRAYA